MTAETTRIPETTHDGENWEQAKRRFWLCLFHPWTRHPEARNRLGIVDLVEGHCITNLYVTYARQWPRSAGHLWRYSILVLLGVILVMTLIWWRL